MSRQVKATAVKPVIVPESTARVLRLPAATKELAQEQRTVSEVTMEEWLAKTVEQTLPKVSAKLIEMGFGQFSTKTAVTKWSLRPATLESLRKVSKQTTLPMNLLLALSITNMSDYKQPKAKPAPTKAASAPKATAAKTKASKVKKGGAK